MIENIKPGDVCVFTNGERAAVTGINKCDTGNIRLRFDRGVDAFTYENSTSSNSWAYTPDGKIYNCFDNPNNIVKIIKGS